MEVDFKSDIYTAMWWPWASVICDWVKNNMWVVILGRDWVLRSRSRALKYSLCMDITIKRQWEREILQKDPWWINNYYGSRSFKKSFSGSQIAHFNAHLGDNLKEKTNYHLSNVSTHNWHNSNHYIMSMPDKSIS